MYPLRSLASALPLALLAALPITPAQAKATDYRFELVGTPQLVAKKDIVHVRLVRIADGKPVPGAVIFESKADMGPAGMPTMPAPVRALPPKDGLYVFEVDPAMAGTWALHLAAKVQGEAETVRGTLNVPLVK